MVRLRGILLGVVFAAIAVGFAAGIPGAMRASDVAPAQAEKQTHKSDKTAKSPHGSDRTANHEPDQKKTERSENDAPDGGGGNHGAVVSAIAKCDVKGRWHGEAVRSIAQDKDADLDDVAAACAAAQAAAAAASTKVKLEHAGPSRIKEATNAKSVTIPRVPKAPKSAPDEASSSALAEPSGLPPDAGPAGDKGNSKKP